MIKNLQQQPNRNEAVDPKQVKIKKSSMNQIELYRTFLFWHEIKDIQFNSITVAVFGHPYSSFWLPLKSCMDLLGSPNGFNHPPPPKKNQHMHKLNWKNKTFPRVDFFAWTKKKSLCKKNIAYCLFVGWSCPSSTKE